MNDNSVIFSNTYLVNELFTILKNRNSDVTGLKLISHQADHKIDKKIFNQKPLNITEWFGINIEHGLPAIFNLIWSIKDIVKI